MPRGDGTGPTGAGPMTGRALGLCAGYAVPGYMNPAPGRGMGRGWGRGMGRGMGRGWGRQAWAPPVYGAPAVSWGPPPPEQETEMLQQQAKALQRQIDAIQKRLGEIEAEHAQT